MKRGGARVEAARAKLEELGYRVISIPPHSETIDIDGEETARVPVKWWTLRFDAAKGEAWKAAE
jgi:hypothetical protein